MTEEQNIPEQNSKEQISNIKEEEVNKNISREQPIEKSETINPKSEIKKSETEKMEVHHHPNLHHRKKHWKEYFLEFLMIFLAVTLGFFAESYREHITNNEIEKNNIESLVKNLEGDSLQLVQLIQFNEIRIKGIDSFLMLKSTNLMDSTVKKKLYYYGFVYVTYFHYFISNDAAIEQMKSSGSLRLIKKQNITDSILKYEYINKDIKLNEDVLHFIYNKILETSAKLYNLAGYTTSSGYQFVPPNFNSLNALTLDDVNIIDTTALKEDFNYAAEEALSLKYYSANLKTQLDYAKNLITFLKKEYNLN